MGGPAGSSRLPIPVGRGLSFDADAWMEFEPIWTLDWFGRLDFGPCVALGLFGAG